MKKLLVMLFLLMIPICAKAEDIDEMGLQIFNGYSYAHANFMGAGQKKADFNGWELSGNLLASKWFGFEFDFTGHYHSGNVSLPALAGACPPVCLPNIAVDTTEHEYLFGPRFHYSKKRVSPFAHILFGASHVTSHATLPISVLLLPINLSTSQTGFAMATGGGVEVRLTKNFSWRTQADYLRTDLFGEGQNSTRVSTGIAIRF